MANNTLFDKVVRSVFRKSQDNQSLKEAIEDLIEDHDEHHADSTDHKTSAHERMLISNILKLREERVEDVMIPRIDIVAIDIDASQDDIFALLAEHQFSRIPVFRGQLDDIIGTIHIKDVLASSAKGETVAIKNIIREIPIVSPAMGVSDLILFMKEHRKHMVLVVDEYGGIDGLVALNDIIEIIVGEIDDEYDTDSHNLLIERQDGTILAEGRVELDDFEEQFGKIFSADEHDDADTLAGLVFMAAGRVPARGEIIQHASGLEFEILDASPRHINRIKIRNLDKT
ncbi:MAG: magnesium/cobalt efflux protein [Alphaproteobacteria bacterium]|nr:MAG: magnesium/cobalt efflux protein [Alphaproteobacteria bacterium]